ncbi:hypothetical protein [Streptococcus hyointestinalis]|uniref:hypothetical protein n=1 Tax=Streptococcus hyointestinalis TaxID=1337 RepID=UPI0013DF66EB|nr:hypothetical protein [Streptococcus hyointestinalis]
MKKYELLKDDTKIMSGRTLYRIKALRDFGNVEKGDLGGYIESENNLSHYGNAWVYDNARVFDNARVCDNAEVFGDAEVYGDARVKSDDDYIVFKNNWSSGRYFTYTKSNKMWKVGCFYGTGQELIEKAYADSELSGKCYEAYVKLVEQLEEIQEDK